ncbi:uncharacterized protein T551_03696, partial [Pneumocystis jirovecii RU7]
HSLARAVARAVKRQTQVTQGVQSVYDDEEYLLALILKEDTMVELQCKEKLKKYCENLEEADKELNKIYPKLKDICKDKEWDKKCTGLKNKVTGKCTPLKTALDKIVLKALEENYDCKEHERQCLFLEGACPNDLIENCNKLRNLCYQRKRDGVAEKVLLRALGENLESEDKCKEKLKQVCLELNEESDELIKLCLNQVETCKGLMTTKEYTCQSLNALKTELEKPKSNKLQEKCLLLLEGCHFHYQSCKIGKQNCDNLKKKCKDTGITYLPPGLDFDPTKPKITLAEKIDLKKLYLEVAKKGIYIGKPSIKDEAALLALLSKDSTQSIFKDQCKDTIKKKCGNFEEHIILKDLCNNKSIIGNPEEKCKELDKELTTRASLVSEKIGKYLATANVKGIIGWHMLYTFLGEKVCAKLLSDCFYLKGQGPLDKECDNLKAACYKKGLESQANEALQDKLQGKLHGSNGTWLVELQKELVKVCKGLKDKSDELFVLCAQPKKAALILSTDLRFRAIFLREQLNEKRDFPTETDCKELEKKCRILGQDSSEIKWSCLTLNQHCDRLRIAEQLEELLLKEKTKDLKDQIKCKESINKRCNDWVKKRKNLFTLACLEENITCQIITKNLESKCNALKENMETRNALTNAADNNMKEKTCKFWTPYCEKFTPSCKKLIEEKSGEKNGLCSQLNKKCESFFKKRELDDKAIDGLKGYLTTKEVCEKTLEKYCVPLNNATNGLETLCKSDDSSKDEKTVRGETCKRLVEQVQEKCPNLQNELTKAKEELKKKEKEYKNLKKEAEEAMKEANLILSRTKVSGDKSENGTASNTSAKGKDTAQFRLVRRDQKPKVTEEEVKAFDLVAQAFGFYVELREKCQDLLKGCGLKKECSCEDQCEKIENTCKKLKPLEVKPYEVKTVTETNITTVTETVKEAEKTVGDGEKCKSLSTSDTWITHTSTHTSTSTTTSTVTSRITLTSTRRCKPTKCTTGEEDEAGEVKPSEGLRMSGWSVMRGVLVVMMISFMI